MLGPAMLTDADSTPKDRNIIWMSVTLRNKQDGEKEDLKFDNTIVEHENAIAVGADDDGFRIEAIDQINGAPIELFDEVIDSIYYSNIASSPVPVGEPIGGDREIVFQVSTVRPLHKSMCLHEHQLVVKQARYDKKVIVN